MIGAAFRFGLIVVCSGFVLGLVEVAERWSVAVAVVVGVVGVTLAVLLAEDWVDRRPAAPAKDSRQQAHRRRGTRPFEDE